MGGLTPFAMLENLCFADKCFTVLTVGRQLKFASMDSCYLRSGNPLVSPH
jgi:hypothetical protein